MPEIAGQRTTGSQLSERQCREIILDGLRRARVGFEGLAALRLDARWVVPVRLIDDLMDATKKHFDKGGPRALWIPGRRN
jgi:hypothetical protein